MERKIIIGTRGSDLALWQANYTRELLEDKGVEAEIKIIETEGDRSQQWETSFDKLEGKGFFTKELEEALLNKTIDLAVHSHKDVQTEQPEGLMIAGVSRREDPSDVLLIAREHYDDSRKFGLREGARVGTSSARRKSQLHAFRPDVKLEDIRGNVPTRIKKLREGQYEAIMLAMAGIERLGLDVDDLHMEVLRPEEFVPAPAQGVLAWQVREDDNELMEAIDKISDLDVLVRINIERQVLAMFDGGCQLPLGVYCDADPDEEDRLKFKVWLSMGKTFEEQPLQMYFETLDTDGFADQIVDQVRNFRPKKVYVTKDFREQDYLPAALKGLGCTVEGKSLIEFKQIRIKELPQTDWIFFSSKHAVRYFFNQKPELGNVKFGCIGTSTSAELRAFGKRADFIGQSTDVKLVGKQFSSKVGSARVLFPIARGSMQSIQWQMVKRENVFNLEVYATLKHSFTIAEDFDILVFTSPSNVEAFFEKNNIRPDQKVVAMGESTGKALEKLKIRKYTMPQTFDDLGLVRAILTA